MAEPVNIFDYARRRDDSNIATNPVDDFFKRKRDSETSAALLQAPDPAKISRANRLARENNIPAPVADDSIDILEAKKQAERMVDLMNQYGAIGRWGGDNRNVAAASDDYDSLSTLGKLWYGVKNVGGALGAGAFGTSQMADDTFQEMDRFNRFVTYPLRGVVATAENAIFGTNTFDPDEAAKRSEKAYEARKAERLATQESLRPKVENSFVQSMLGGVESVPLTLGAVATRSPKGGTALIGTLVAAGETQRGRDAGLSTPDAIRFGATQGLVEYTTEKRPVGKLIGDIAKKIPFARTFFNQLVREVPGEQAATILQDMNEWGTLNPEKTLAEFLAERPTAAVDTFAATLGGVGVTTTITTAADRTARSGVKLLDKVTQSQSAKEDGDFIDRLDKAMQTSKLRGRDPEAFKNLIKMMADDNEVSDVYIPDEQIQEYFQSDNYDPDSTEAEWLNGLEEAAPGGDVVVPVEQLSDIAGTSLFEGLKDHIRFSAGGMSRSEAQGFDESMNEIMDELAEAAAVEQESLGARDTLNQSITDKLMNAGFTPVVARQQAELLTNRYATRFERLGRELTGQEFDEITVNQVLPESLATAQQLDGLDIVINSLKARSDPKGQPSLLDFISSQGGIEDRGGDLKAMGADKWHKDKAFRKKLLRPFDDAQPSMLGQDGQQNTNSPDEIALRAWEAGYFPELTERPSVNDLLEAIGEGIAGRDRFAEDEVTSNAADELAQILDQMGLDETASKKEIEKALDQYSQEAGGFGYDQAAFHGSPHIFDKFSTDAMGTGEGAQAYGWGLYFAGKKEVAEFYRDALTQGNTVHWRNKFEEAGIDAGIIDTLVRFEDGVLTKGTIKRFKEMNDRPGSSPMNEQWRQSVRDAMPGIEKVFEASTGRLYEVDIPEDTEYLLWDVPLSEQPEKVREAVRSVYLEAGGDKNWFSEDGKSEKDGKFFYSQIAYTGNTLTNTTSEKGDKATSLALREAGIAGIKYLDGGSRSDGDGTYNYVVFDDSDVSIRAYEQAFEDGARGRISFPNEGFQGAATIDLFKTRNMSTLLHETGHLWLEELRFDASDPDAPKQLKDDYKAVEKWFKNNGHEVKGGVIPVEAHEMWARGVERYLMEGKAPARSLNSLFESFKGWLISIYKSVEALRSPISPEIREVMDRLIATDSEIAEAKEAQSLDALFTDAAEAGMSGKEFEAYQKLTSDARSAAHSSMIDKTMRSIRYKRKRENKARVDAVRTEATENVDGRQEFRVFAAAQQSPIDSGWISETLGPDSVQLMPRGSKKVGGINPDQLAEQYGYSTGEDLVTTLMGMEAQRRELKEGGDKRSLRAAAIEQEIDSIIESRYGNPLNDGSIEEEVLAAVHNDAQGEVISAEIRALGRRTGRTATPYSLAKEWARGRIRSGEVRLEASRSAIQRYKRAAERASKNAQEAMLKGDFDAVFQHKQAQMVNNALVSEAKTALDEVESAVKRLDKIAKKKTIKSVNQEHLEQAHSLLENVNLRQESQTGIDRRGMFEEWAQGQIDAGHDIVVPTAFEGILGTTNWSRLTVENLLSLDEAVKQIIHLGRRWQTLNDNKERREFDAIVGEAVTGMGDLKQKPPSDLMEPSFPDRLKSGIMAGDAALLKMETMFDWLDNNTSGNKAHGVFNRVVFQPIADAQAQENDMMADYQGQIREAFEKVGQQAVRRWGDKVSSPLLLNRETGQPYIMKRHSLIAMALNVGNEGNMQRLADGYGWSEQNITDVLNSELSQEEWAFVQEIWDIIDGLWPSVEAMERNINGVAPEKIKARSFETPFGTVKGGYYPAIYDQSKSVKAEVRSAKNEDLFEANYLRATTRASSTKERAAQNNEPILLQLGVINRHIGEVIHDVTHREPLMEAHKFLTDKRIVKAVDSTLGKEYRSQFRPWLNFVANQWAMEKAGAEGWGRFADKARANTTIVGMGWRITTILTQIAGYSNSYEFVGPKWVNHGIATMAKNPIDTFNFVMEKSGEVRHRMNTIERDINQTMRAMAGKTSYYSAAKRFAFHGIGYFDRAVAIPTWIGAYEKALSQGKSDIDAVQYADKSVRLSQGAGSAKDMAAIQRGTGRYGMLMKFMTMFYSFVSANHNRIRTLMRDSRSAKTKDVPALLARAVFITLIPSVLPEILSGRGPEEDEDWALWTMQRMLTLSVAAVPGVRDIADPLWDKVVGRKGFDYQLSPVQRAGQTIANIGGDVGKVARGDETKRATRNFLEGVGYTTGLVPGQFASSAQFLVNVGDGDEDPDGLAEWIEGLTKGRIKE